ncbi:MAG: AMP-binding protein [Acidimicrobiia bacterium]|nr:AMP-binding protein [Acidimicrobiia bacterium]
MLSQSRSSHIDTFCRDGMPPKSQLPDLIFTIPEVNYPDRLNAASVLLAGGDPEAPCVSGGGVAWTYGELGTWSARIAHVLVDEHGLVPGNRVILRGGNNPWTVACWLAVLRAGGVVVTTIPILRPGEMEKVIAKSEPSVALCEATFASDMTGLEGPAWRLWGDEGEESLETVAATKPDTFDDVDTSADDVALIAFTSGTTGEPKAPMHFHRDLLAIADTFGKILKARSDDVFTGSPPLAFTFGLGGEVVFPMRLGASTVYPDKPGPEPLAQTIDEANCTVCFTSPTAYRALMGMMDRFDLSSLRRPVSAGETLGKTTYDAFLETTGVKIIDGIGSTEMLHIFVSASDDDIRPGATGLPVPGFEAKVVDKQGHDVPDGEVGRLAVRGPVGCRYLDDERQTTYVQDGWNLTGDAYIRDSDGYFWYQARTDDMIISSGYNIASPEVEEALLSHEEVMEAGVIGVDDPDRGQLVRAFVHLRDPSMASDDLAKELQDHVKATISPYKYPRAISFSDTPLPKTLTGKLQRFALHDLDS